MNFAITNRKIANIRNGSDRHAAVYFCRSSVELFMLLLKKQAELLKNLCDSSFNEDRSPDHFQPYLCGMLT